MSGQQGFLYVATGERRFTFEAIRSARSLRRHFPQADICLFTDHFHAEVTDYDVFTRLQKLPSEARPGTGWLEHLQFKIAAMLASPYQQTAFIDADTVVCSPRIQRIFDALQGKDVAISERQADNSISRQLFGQRMYSTGVILYEANPKTRSMLQEWHDSNARNLRDMRENRLDGVVCIPSCTTHQKKFLLGTDQYSLALILAPDINRYELKVGALDTRFNHSHLQLPRDYMVVDHRPNIKLPAASENSDGFYRTFHSTICETFLGIPLPVRKGLIELIRQRVRPQDDDTKSGVGALRTENLLLFTDDPNIFSLKQALSPIVIRMFKEMFERNSNFKGGLTLALEGWGYILRPGNFIAPHQHVSGVIAGTYYLSVPDSAMSSEQGHLVIQNPNLAEGYTLRDHLVYNKVVIAPSPDKLVMFPSYLSHYVMPFQGEGERIALSFDVRPRPIQASPPPAAKAAERATSPAPVT